MSSNPISRDVVQGDDISYQFKLYQDDAKTTPVDLVGATITSDIRKEYSQPVAASFTVENTDLPNGTFTLKMSGATTAGLSLNAKGRITSFVWDVQVKFQDGTIKTPVYGYLKVQRQVTA
jgi:hypothetical protein